MDLPTAVHGPQGCTVRWRAPRYHAVHRLLTSPFYAGAYVFGRTATRTRVEDGRKVVTHGVARRREDWAVLIRDHHDGTSPGPSMIATRR
ncbi:recombinase family protein [Mesorhizobium sp.]|uniref:recombinase family protein n=1 Tax=Mesorhizobium sp. TaxID=1871066 RepID=UPI00345DF78F